MPLLGSRGAASARGFGFSANTKQVPTVIGQPFGGGYYVGPFSMTGNGVATHYLIISPKSVGEVAEKLWGPLTTFTNSDIDGKTNSASLNSSTYPAAFFCEGLSIGGYTDWFLPAKLQLEIAYYNLKPGTQPNRPTSPFYGVMGINNYAVPQRPTGYTTSVPPQTSAGDFIRYNGEAFEAFGEYYWTSTSFSNSAWWQKFDDGEQGRQGKNGLSRVRAFRAEPV
jgi:hypothetical protein